MAKKNRDDFTEKTKLQIAKRAGWLCSYPPCRKLTVGATSDGQSEINVGTAAHICAAAPGGPRYDPNMSSEDRSSANNGIWMCSDHGKAIDSHDPEFTVERLHEWKQQAEQYSWRLVLRNETSPLPDAATDGQLVHCLRAAAEADLTVFRRTVRWPATTVALTLKVESYGEPATTNALASAVTTLDDLILVAAPGMGKTTALFQIAEGVLASRGGTPLVVPLGDWATESSSVLDSILKRPAFRGISEDDFRAVASKPGVVLLLDGWNELGDEARQSARVQVAALKSELPALGLIVTTRRQALDVPFVGTSIDLLPLNEEQQMNIATAIRGEAGVKIIDQAWRTEGVRELVSIPLYLTALLSLPENLPFPTTKEEILRYFVAAHEREASSAEALRAVLQGFQQDYLESLAVFATRTASTAIADSNARRSISETENTLVANGQITVKPQPDAVLDVLVSHHVLLRTGDAPGYSFQHQQFQEWYTSHSVERRIIAEAADPVAREALKAEVFNLPALEEAILFAVERLTRGDAYEQAACAKAILAAFEVDPILAAEMISRLTEEVWTLIAGTIQGLVAQWHVPGKVDRAHRFMLTSGRPEFFDLVWPLITHEDDQISLRALRNCRRFRPSILGKDAEKRIRSLSQKVRTVLLREIASHSGMDGLDLVTIIAKNDPDAEVKAAVVTELAFRRAHRHVDEVLQNADEKTFDLVVRKYFVNDSTNDYVRKELARARERQISEGMSAYDQLHAIVYADDSRDRSMELTDIISTMEIRRRQDAEIALIYEARNRYPSAVVDGVLARVRAGRTLFYGADEILASAGFSLEDDELLELALAETSRRDDRAKAAASVLGPLAVGRMIEAYIEARKGVHDVNGKYNEAAGDRYYDLRARIGHTSGASLIAAVQARAADANIEEIAELARLLSRQSDSDDDRARPFSTDELAAIGVLVQHWGERVLASGDAASRWQVASLATLISYAPSVSLLPLLKRLLDDNLRRYRAFREEAEASGGRHGKAVSEARWPLMDEYKRAFLAINAPQTTALMEEYLADEHFGQLAATVLAAQWAKANEPKGVKKFRAGWDLSQVESRRTARDAQPEKTSPQAEAIFGVINSLIADGSTDDQKKRAVALGIVAVRLPHGQRKATIEKLISLAPRQSRAKLLLNLIFSGEEIDVKLVAAGIAEVFEAAENDPWILTQGDAYQLKDWLRLLPFTDHPAEAMDIVGALPDAQRNPYFLEEMVDALGHSPSDEAEDVLFKLAEEDPRFYASHSWRSTILQRETLTAARRLLDLTAEGVFDGNSTDGWHLAQQIGGLIDQQPSLRAHIFALLKNGLTSPGLALLAQVLAENPDTECLLLLIRFEIEQKRTLLGWRTVELVVTEHVPSEDWKGAYSVVPVPAVELRKRLLHMTTSGGVDDTAARCLSVIDKIRDDYGTPESEPRHPDLASGRPWPIVTFDPVVESTD